MILQSYRIPNRKGSLPAVELDFAVVAAAAVAWVGRATELRVAAFVAVYYSNRSDPGNTDSAGAAELLGFADAARTEPGTVPSAAAAFVEVEEKCIAVGVVGAGVVEPVAVGLVVESSRDTWRSGRQERRLPEQEAE